MTSRQRHSMAPVRLPPHARVLASCHGDVAHASIDFCAGGRCGVEERLTGGRVSKGQRSRNAVEEIGQIGRRVLTKIKVGVAPSPRDDMAAGL